MAFFWFEKNPKVKVQNYSEVPNRRADQNKRAGLEKKPTLPAFLLSKLINEQGGIFCLLHEKLQAGWKENLKNLSEHVLLSIELYNNKARHESRIVNTARWP